MSNSFGYIDIILLGMIAGFIILRLRSILGRKTGHQSKIYPDFTEKKFTIPKSEIKPIKQNHEILDGKNKKEFLKGAEIAYETILTSFANGDLKKLKGLLTTPMNVNFSGAIEARNQEKIKMIVFNAPTLLPILINRKISSTGKPIKSNKNEFICQL